MSSMISMASNDKVDVDSNSDNDSDGDDISRLFICEEYITKSWEFRSMSQELLCSNMSSVSYYIQFYVQYSTISYSFINVLYYMQWYIIPDID